MSPFAGAAVRLKFGFTTRVGAQTKCRQPASTLPSEIPTMTSFALTAFVIGAVLALVFVVVVLASSARKSHLS